MSWIVVVDVVVVVVVVAVVGEAVAAAGDLQLPIRSARPGLFSLLEWGWR